MQTGVRQDQLWERPLTPTRGKSSPTSKRWNKTQSFLWAAAVFSRKVFVRFVTLLYTHLDDLLTPSGLVSLQYGYENCHVTTPSFLTAAPVMCEPTTNANRMTTVTGHLPNLLSTEEGDQLTRCMWTHTWAHKHTHTPSNASLRRFLEKDFCAVHNLWSHINWNLVLKRIK